MSDNKDTESNQALSYLIEQHKHCQKMMDLYSSPSNGRPAFASKYIERLKSLDMAIASASAKG